jgi:transcriptional regulator with XRE-family HTH domain
MLAIVSIQARVFDVAELGRVIRRVRRERRLTQIELAERANVARGAVQKLEEGRGTVNLTTVLKILRMLSLDLTITTRESANALLFDENRPRG